MTRANKTRLEEIQTFFDFAQPKRLRKNITFLFTQYHVNTPVDSVVTNSRQIAEDVEFVLTLIDLLGRKWNQNSK